MAALARQLAQRHAVTVLTSRAAGLPSECIESGVRVLRVPVLVRRERAVANTASMFAYLPMGALRAWRLVERERFDVVNTHFVVPTGPLGQLLAAHAGVPHVLTVHGGDLYDPSKRSSPHRHWWLRLAIRRLLRAADRIVGQSHDTLARVRSIYGVERQTELIPLGIERPGMVGTVSRAEFALPEDAFVLVTVGRLVARKAVLQLLEVLGSAAPPRAHLLVVGDGPERAAIQRAAAQGGLADRVHLLGQVDERRKWQALSVADVFATTSQHEGFGLVFLEAMAFGLPVVCYDRGGQTDFLQTGQTGAVVPLNDLQAFGRALLELSANEPLRRRLGEYNRQQVEGYLIDRCAQRYEAVFESAMREHLAGRPRARASLGTSVRS